MGGWFCVSDVSPGTSMTLTIKHIIAIDCCWSPSLRRSAQTTVSAANDRRHDAIDPSAVVASIEETAERYHIPKPFIGLILLPIVVRIRSILVKCVYSETASSGQFG